MKSPFSGTYHLQSLGIIISLFSTSPYMAKTQDTSIVYAETSLGDLIDKILVLKIKQEKIQDSAKRINIDKELQLLQDILQKNVQPSQQLEKLSAQLLQVNKNLWTLEDAVRLKEQQQGFDHEFIAIVDSILTNNDERACIKRTINLLCRSHIIEEKSYVHIKEAQIDHNTTSTEPIILMVPLPLGDLVDRITILLIKKEHITDHTKLAHILSEYDALNNTLTAIIGSSAEFSLLAQDLLQANKTNWDNFERIRLKKQLKEFDTEFINLARSIYRFNDRRCDTKKQINIYCGSSLIEEKCYTTY
jgi:hypothetical protein